MKKYYDVSFSGSDNDNNWIELRLADIYLLYAEALVRQGKQQDIALTLPQQDPDREPATAPEEPGYGRPGLRALSAPMPTLLLAIEKERRVELAFENHRWFDLVRTERAKAVMTQEQKEQNGFNPAAWNDNMLLFPIPLQVIQSNPEKSNKTLATKTPGAPGTGFRPSRSV